MTIRSFRFKKFLIRLSIVVVVISVILALVANSIVERATDQQVYADVQAIPANRVGLLLGTSRLLSNGKPNQYFDNRIDAVVQLINARKIQFVLISGDNSRPDYNEPKDMKEALMKRGLPENRIFLDFAGFRTYDSVYRIKAIFGQSQFTIISQEFHNRRAIYIAQQLHLNAIGYNARSVDKFYGFKTNLREKLSRVKMFIDFARGIQPRFLGEKVVIQ